MKAATIRKYITLIALGLAGGVMYVYPYIRYVFHAPLVEALGCNEAEAGFLITCYGVVSLLLYIPGGILADKIRAKKPLVLSMSWAFILIAGFGVILGLDLGPATYYFAISVWVLIPFATTFVFWSSLVKAIGMAGDADEQGRCFGIYFASNAVFATIISSTNMFAYTTFSTSDTLPSGFCGVTLNVAMFVLVAILAVIIFFRETKAPQDKAPLNPDTKVAADKVASNSASSNSASSNSASSNSASSNSASSNSASSNPASSNPASRNSASSISASSNSASSEGFKLSDVRLVLKNKNIWIASITMMLIYMMFTCVTYFTPYMVDICGLNPEMSGALSIFRTYVIMIFAAIFSGVIADKIFHSTLRWFKFASICLAISTVVFLLFGFSGIRNALGIPNNIYVIALISIIPGIFSTMIYAIQFSVLSEISIPAKLAGTASGIASVFVFSPDIYFNTALGAIIDWGNNAGQIEAAYLIIFGILIALCLSVFALCKVLLNTKTVNKC